MNNKHWLDNIKQEDLMNLDMQLVAERCGIDVAISLLKNMQGETIRIPTKSFLNLRNHYIKTCYDGTKSSIYNLVKEFDLSEKYIKHLIKKSD